MAIPSSDSTQQPNATLTSERCARLQEKLRLLYQQYDLETRVEEKLRIKAIIDQTETDLLGL